MKHPQFVDTRRLRNEKSDLGYGCSDQQKCEKRTNENQCLEPVVVPTLHRTLTHFIILTDVRGFIEILSEIYPSHGKFASSANFMLNS